MTDMFDEPLDQEPGMSNIHENCPRHSGMESRSNLLIWLLGILIVIASGQFWQVSNLRSEISSFSFQFRAAEQSRLDLKAEIIDLKSRVARLETYELGHKEVTR